MFKILIPEDVAESGKEYLKERGYELKVGVPTDVENLKKEIRDADGILVRNALYPEEVLAAGEKLKVIGRHGTGVDNIDVAAATRMGIQVTNAPVSNINAVAEYTAAMIIALGCRLRTCRRLELQKRDAKASERIKKLHIGCNRIWACRQSCG